ncbi:MAG: HNH endonuclease [Reyranellaceae bacterium]
MAAYWWVNHNQTVRQEIEGQYLWSPKAQSNGHRNHFYDNMRRASPDDLVLSFSGQAIRYVGRVAQIAFTAPKPPEFGQVGSYWSNEGWYLPVFWTEIVPYVRPKSLIGTLGPLLPRRYSPIDPETGNGRQNVYLAEIPKAVFEMIVSGAAHDIAARVQGGRNSLTFDSVSEFLEDIVQRQVLNDPELDSTTKENVVQARRGQGRFRANVQALERSCRLTGVTNPTLLIASHIKPWRLCDSAHERLDGMNGLLLTPDADRLFDRGFISFEDSGQVLVSPRVDQDDLSRLGFQQLVRDRFGLAEAPANWRTDSFTEQRRRYLDYHRANVFVD